MTSLRVGHFLLYERSGNVIPKINSAHGSETRNIINVTIDSINAQGKSIQDLVAEGQLTPTQYLTLIEAVNGLISKGNVSALDIDKNLGKFDATYFSEKFISDLSNGTVNTTNVVDGSITLSKMDTTLQTMINEWDSVLTIEDESWVI